MSSTPVQPPATEPAALSEGARLLDVFIAPTKTFTDLRRSAMWWAPFLILAIVAVGFVYVVDRNIGFRKVTENQIAASSKASARIEQMQPEQRNQALNQQAKITRYISYGYWIFVLVWNIIVALILFGTFKLVAGSDVKFSTSIAVVMYACLPLSLKSVLAAVSVLAGVSPDSFTFQNPIATNPGYFLDPTSSHFLYSLGTSLDVFMIWTLVLTAIGFTCVSKLKRSTAYAVVFGWYVLVMIVGAALAAAFS